MRITNKYNIPETIVNVVHRPTYSKGRANLSVTQLINSPKIVALTTKFEHELEQDVSDMVWQLFGSAIHKVLEHGKAADHVVEERLFREIDGWVISGAIDLQIMRPEGVLIRDYKTTSAWAVLNEKIEWEQQLNIYAWLVETVKQQPVTDLSIIAIIRDWSRREAAAREEYPQAPVKEIPIRSWTHEDRENFILHRIAQHSACELAIETEDELPDCSPEDMWERPTTWAVKKKGGVRAKSLHTTEAHARVALEKAGSGYEIEVRKGERVRCASFCLVNQFCAQWRRYQEEQSE